LRRPARHATIDTVINGLLLAESLRPAATVAVPGVVLRSIRRADVSSSTTPEQPGIWTFVEFEAPSEVADALAGALAAALSPDGGWYADFSVDDDHVVVFAGRIFRYHRDDAAGRAEAQDYGRSVGVPEHQLDWG
jgi:hypothetical protein